MLLRPVVFKGLVICLIVLYDVHMYIYIWKYIVQIQIKEEEDNEASPCQDINEACLPSEKSSMPLLGGIYATIPINCGLP